MSVIQASRLGREGEASATKSTQALKAAAVCALIEMTTAELVDPDGAEAQAVQIAARWLWSDSSSDAQQAVPPRLLDKLGRLHDRIADYGEPGLSYS